MQTFEFAQEGLQLEPHATSLPTATETLPALGLEPPYASAIRGHVRRGSQQPNFCAEIPQV
jgi:hypothetical protein